MSCEPYPKIETLFDRGDDFRVNESKIRRPEFLIPREWVVTEKVDGTNVRVSLEPVCDTILPERVIEWRIAFYGRTENAQMPTFLLDHLQRTFTLERMQNLWRGKPSCDKCGGLGQFDSGEPKTLTRNYSGHRDYQCDCVEPYPIVLYGEGYGAKIQKGGGHYRRDGDVSFRLFDVLIGGTWLRRTDVEDVTHQLGIEAVPQLEVDDRGTLTTGEIVQLVRTGFESSVANMEGIPWLAEGVVAFTNPPLFDSRGRRLMWKLKTKDFA